MNPKSRKIKLSRDSLFRLTASADGPLASVLPSHPKICEQTNITCFDGCE